MNQQSNLRLPEQNSVMLIGRLTRDPELRRTGTGKAVCSFDIAVNRRYKDSASGEWKDDTVFVPVVVWEAQAERCAERLKKGSPVSVEGKLRSNKWEGQDGVKRTKLEVWAQRVQFLSFSAKADENVIGAKTGDGDVSVASNSDDDKTTSYSDDDEEIPF
ncbi:MAG: single-stranded DNA-binding protein [Elusimicrobiota bacterium]|jgi:single-strand DNA-binding protein|nr:single-stranded DNA-binding protein [Elusimicrobiota bacterium]